MLCRLKSTSFGMIKPSLRCEDATGGRLASPHAPRIIVLELFCKLSGICSLTSALISFLYSYKMFVPDGRW